MDQHWIDWHAAYDDPHSSLAQRLVVVQQCIREALDFLAATAAASGLRIISLCAGDGRDLLPVLSGTVATLRTLTEPSGYGVWTRGREATRDPSSEVREWFRQEGFTESSFIAPTAARFRVGMHRLNPADALPYRSGVRMFAFLEA